LILHHAQGDERFPVDVERLALEWPQVLDPEAPITKVVERPLEGFEGALVEGRSRGRGWGIAYSKDISSPGRRRFTIAHELGHYLLHRDLEAGGFQCSQVSHPGRSHRPSPDRALHGKIDSV